MFSQSNFHQQKYEIKEKITASLNSAYHKDIYYPKFYYKLNHIKHFWCNTKDYIQIKCDYTFDELQKYMTQALASVKNFIILGCYN